jgi:hypothetical protein
MPTTNGNRKLLDLKRWEMCAPLPQITNSAMFVASSRHFRQQQMLVSSATVAQLHNPGEDGWVAVPSPALGSFAVGACGVGGAISTGATAGVASLTATGGTTSTIVTNQTLARALRGYHVHILAGPNAGVTLEILSNTIGANATIIVDEQGSAFTASTVYRLITPVWYVFGGGTLAVGSFRKYDYATNTWVTLANTGLPASFGTDGKLFNTPSWIDTGYKQFATGTATAGGASTLTNSARNWTTNQWANCQVRIVSGTNAGQIRTIASNTATVLTTTAAWPTPPDATTVYSIEGNDDFLYLLGNNAVTLYRYSIVGNTWTTLAPTLARAGVANNAVSAHWIHSATAAEWKAENTIQNGRYVYSFRGGGSAALDRYDIALNTWAALTYAPATETLTTGTKYCYLKDRIYITKEATGRWFVFDVVENAMHPWSTMLYPQGGAVIGDTSWDATFRDGTTEIDFVYMALNTSAIVLRQMVI